MKRDPALRASDPREGLALVAAALLHAGIVASSVLVPAAAEIAAGSRERPLDAIEVSMLEPAPREAPAPGSEAAAAAELPQPEPAAKLAAASPRLAAARPSAPAEPAPEPSDATGSDTTEPRDATAAGDATEPAPPPAAPPAADDYGPNVAPESPLPGLGGPPVWSIPGLLAGAPDSAPAPTVPAAPRPVDEDIAGQVLRGTLRKKDKALGIDLPAAPVVAQALSSAVRSSEAPPDARARFEVRLGSDGRVLGISVASSTAGNAATWERIARGASAALAATTLGMGGGAPGGATVIVKVESKLLYPAGSKEQVAIRPVCANDVLRELEQALGTDPGRELAAAGSPPPADEKTDDDPTRFCIPIGVGGVGDLSNIGAKAHKLVRASYEVILPGERDVAPDVQPVDTRARWLRDKNRPKPNTPYRLRKWEKKRKKAAGGS